MRFDGAGKASLKKKYPDIEVEYITRDAVNREQIPKQPFQREHLHSWFWLGYQTGSFMDTGCGLDLRDYLIRVILTGLAKICRQLTLGLTVNNLVFHIPQFISQHSSNKDMFENMVLVFLRPG